MIDDDAPLTTSDPAPPRRAKNKQRSVKPADQAPADHLWVGSAAVWVPEAWPAMYPLVGQLVSEDLSWRAGMLHWQSCRPGRFQLRARASWRAHGETLAAKRGRLRETARELGFRMMPEEKPKHWWSWRSQ